LLAQISLGVHGGGGEGLIPNFASGNFGGEVLASATVQSGPPAIHSLPTFLHTSNSPNLEWAGIGAVRPCVSVRMALDFA